MTNQFYCYVYYDDHWQAYYVGKGRDGRMYHPSKHPQIPSEDHVQVFHFKEEWQAWECEIELIAFWKRQCDGGPLLNKSTGGAGGGTGVKRSAEHCAKLSAAMSGKKIPPNVRAKISAAMSGNNNPNYGKKLSVETRAKMSAARSKYWENKRNA